MEGQKSAPIARRQGKLEAVGFPSVKRQACRGHDRLFTADCHNVHPNFLQAPSQVSSGVEEKGGLGLFLDQARGKMATRCLIC